MKLTLKEIIEKSGKKKTVSFKNKEKRNSFDENYAKNKMNVVKEFIGNQSVELSEKLAIK